MKIEPLKNSTWYVDAIRPEPTGKFNAKVFPFGDVASAVEWLKQKIQSRHDEFEKHSHLKSECKEDYVLLQYIDEAFPDVSPDKRISGRSVEG